MRLYYVSLSFVTALTLLGLCDAAHLTFRPKFGTGTWTAFGSVRSPADDIWTPGGGPGGVYWISPGGSWRPAAGSPIRNPVADTWTPVSGAGAFAPGAVAQSVCRRGDWAAARQGAHPWRVQADSSTAMGLPHASAARCRKAWSEINAGIAQRQAVLAIDAFLALAALVASLIPTPAG